MAAYNESNNLNIISHGKTEEKLTGCGRHWFLSRFSEKEARAYPSLFSL